MHQLATSSGRAALSSPRRLSPRAAACPRAFSNKRTRGQRPEPRRGGGGSGGGGGGGGGWLGGLPSWPSRGGDQQQQPSGQQDDELDDPSMRPINEVLGASSSTSSTDGDNDGPASDPLAMVVAGLSQQELERLRAALHAIDADIVRLIPCPRAALEEGGAGLLTLEQAVRLEQCPAWEPAPDDLPGPVVFLSGMSGPEVAEIVRCYREDPQPPLPRAAFCALVRGNRRRRVGELARSVWTDERRVIERRQQQQQREAAAGEEDED